jgi:hypothetical protein
MTSVQSPYERIYSQYRDKMPDADFSKIVGWHLQHCYLFSTPEFFCMARPVSRFAPESEVRECTTIFSPYRSDAWYFHAFSGDMSAIWASQGLVPQYNWVGFDRMREGKLELTWVELSRLKRLTMQTTQEAVI